MFTKDTPKEISRLFDLIEAVQQKFQDRFTINKQSRQGELSLVFKTADLVDILYLGVRYDLWTRAQNPLWFGVQSDWNEKVVNLFSEHNQGRWVPFENFRLCPVPPELTMQDEYKELIIEMLEEQLNIVDKHHVC